MHMMLEIRKTAVSLDESDLLELARIVTDADEKVFNVHAPNHLAASRARLTIGPCRAVHCGSDSRNNRP